MICPFCGKGKPGVANTYGFLEKTIVRVRRCHVCGFSFSTTEQIDQDGDFKQRRAEYDRKKAEASKT